MKIRKHVLRNFNFCKVNFFSKMKKVFDKNFSCFLVLSCFEPKNHRNLLHHFGDMAKIPTKTQFFTIFAFLAFLTYPNNQKIFGKARCKFFHVLNHLKKFCQNWGTPWPKVSSLAWIQSNVYDEESELSRQWQCRQTGFDIIDPASLPGKFGLLIVNISQSWVA